MGKKGNYANIVRGLAPLFRHSEWPDSTLLIARNPKLLRQRYNAKEFAHTCMCKQLGTPGWAGEARNMGASACALSPINIYMV